MKKAISLVMCAVMLLCCGSFAGCNQKSSNPTPNDLLKALKAGGYKDSHYISYDMAVLMSDIEKSWTIEIYGTEGDIYIKTYADPDAEIIRGGITIENYSGSKNKEDTIKILNIVMPLFDDDFNNAGEDIINHIEELSKDKSNATKSEVLDSVSYYFNYDYHDFTFSKETDENFKDESITVHTYQAYLEKNNLTTKD